MSAEEVIRVLSAKEMRLATGFKRLPKYLHSKDALQPILERLTEPERNVLMDHLSDMFCDGTTDDPNLFQFLTIPARDLAHAIAEILQKSV